MLTIWNHRQTDGSYLALSQPVYILGVLFICAALCAYSLLMMKYHSYLHCFLSLAK